MSVIEEIRTELKDAMRSKDQARLNVLRLVQTEVSTAKAAPGFEGEIDDALYLGIIKAYVKKMQKAHQQYVDAGERGKDLAATLAFEIEYLDRWLPKKMGADETRTLVENVIQSLGVGGDPKAVGRVMGHIMKDHKDQVDGGLVGKLARELLQG